MISSNEENSSAIMNKICEHGQILMTINNLYNKVNKDQNWQLVEVIRKEQEHVPKHELQSFEYIDVVVEKSLS